MARVREPGDVQHRTDQEEMVAAQGQLRAVQVIEPAYQAPVLGAACDAYLPRLYPARRRGGLASVLGHCREDRAGDGYGDGADVVAGGIFAGAAAGGESCCAASA
ncbi:hypothetical protein D3C72_1851590 [compost metagenome]